jgi:hypothetical protein
VQRNPARQPCHPKVESSVKSSNKTERNKQRIDWQQNVMGLIHFVLASFLSSGFTSLLLTCRSACRGRVLPAIDPGAALLSGWHAVVTRYHALRRLNFFFLRPHIFGVRARQIGSIPAKSTTAYFSMPATGT